MAVATRVWCAVLVVCWGWAVRVRGEDRGRQFEAMLTRPGQHFRFPTPEDRRSDPPVIHLTKDQKEEEEHLQNKRKQRYNQGEVYFIPVRFDMRHSFSDRRISSGDYNSAPSSPRLIIDKDYNIRFDNPYIIPLTKPLSLVLDNAVKARQDSYSGENMMIPFPLLVKSRKPLLDREGFRDYRDDDDVPEHRSSDDDEELYLEDTSARNPTKKGIYVKRTKNNMTTAYLNSHEDKTQEGEAAVAEQSQDRMVPESRIINRKPNGTVDPNEEDVIEDSSDDVTTTDTYPGKIFAEMYHKIPTYPFDSLESQEHVGRKGPPTMKYSHEEPTEGIKTLQRPRVKSASKYPINSQMFSASTDFEWVTHANSTKARNLPKTDDIVSSGIVIHDVTEEAFNTTILPPFSTSSPQDINELFWRKI